MSWSKVKTVWTSTDSVAQIHSAISKLFRISSLIVNYLFAFFGKQFRSVLLNVSVSNMYLL